MVTKIEMENALRITHLNDITRRLNEYHPFFSKVKHSTDAVWGREIRVLNLPPYKLVATYGSVSIPADLFKKAEGVSEAFNLLNEDHIEYLIHATIYGLSERLFTSKEGFNGLNTLLQLRPTEEVHFNKLTASELEELLKLHPEADMVLCNHKNKRDFVLDLWETYTVGDSSMFDNFKGASIVGDSLCPEDVIYIINTKDFEVQQLCDWRWVEDDMGRILQKDMSRDGYGDGYVATMVKYLNLVCKAPDKQLVVGLKKQ